MKLFNCPKCNHIIFFENESCEKCKSKLGYNYLINNFSIPDLASNLTYCFNYNHNSCNWVIDTSSNSKFCVACNLNRKIPNKADIDAFDKYKRLELAKHRLVYQLVQLKLPIDSKIVHEKGLAFDFLSENNDENKRTGHANGVVTIILKEADSVHRELLRKQMNEPYRTLLGHFRHEIGHYYWPLLFKENNIKKFRSLFGDERLDYGVALENHYKNGAKPNWNSEFISSYAASHPWEDWAETWAHYLHIMDTLETANYIGFSIKNKKNLVLNNRVLKFKNPYKIKNFKKIFEASISLTSAANSLNRSMGLPDIYPFVIPKPVYKKLEFIHNLLFNTNVNLT
ncbi:putative zinc-binding metallopeptidase [Polaribacter sp. Asnod1-A03]|uniref:zinc-binding metallopeptidase family protein n=1 Tax=Polaribacter sp. Asnod1-A03 TaxID=3160581 RepID=UPI00386D895E